MKQGGLQAKDRRRRGRRCAAVWAVVLCAAGCKTASQDFNDIGASISPKTPQEAGRMMVDPYDSDNRREGTVLIANSPFGGADAYMAMYRDRVVHEMDPLVKAASITALGRYGVPADAPMIAACLVDDNELVRWEAAKALQRIHNTQVASSLLKTLRIRNESRDVRVAAALALGQYNQDRVFQGLVWALDAQALAVNAAALESLTVLTGEDFGFNPTQWLHWYKACDDPFANGRDYKYPTYKRGATWLEKLVFWSNKTYEEPGSPAGLKSSSTRTTYQDDDAATHETGG